MASRHGNDLPAYLRQTQMIMAGSRDGVIVAGINHEITWANSAALAMHGVRSCEELGKTVDEYHANFQVRFRLTSSVDADATAGGPVLDGAPRPVMIEVTPFLTDTPARMYQMQKFILTDEAGRPAFILFTLREVEQAARSGPENCIVARGGAPAGSPEVEALVAVSPALMHALDNDMRIISVSAAWLTWLGYPREAVIGRKITDFMTAPAATHFETHTWHALVTADATHESECDFITSHRQVRQALVCAKATLVTSDGTKTVVATPVDITVHRRIEESISSIFSVAPIPMIIRKFDDSRIIDVNEAFLAATEFEPANIIGHSVDELGIFETKAHRQQLETAIHASGQASAVEVRVKTAHGEPIVCRLTAKAIYAFGQKCTLLMLQDVSDRHRNEVQLFEAIESVMKDTSWFSRSVIERLAVLRAPPGNGSASAALKDLTPREREVIGLISHGLSDAEIAQRLGLTRSTVRNHVATLYSKISVHSRSSAIVWARERGVNIAYPAKSKPGPTPLGSSRLRPVKMNRTSAKRQAWLTEADRALSGD